MSDAAPPQIQKVIRQDGLFYLYPRRANRSRGKRGEARVTQGMSVLPERFTPASGNLPDCCPPVSRKCGTRLKYECQERRMWCAWATYYFRIKIPTFLRSHNKKKLHDKDQAEAKRKDRSKRHTYYMASTVFDRYQLLTM